MTAKSVAKRAACVAAVATMLAAGAQAADPVRLQLHLVGRHTDDEVEREFMERSSPKSQMFRKHMTPAQLRELFGAEPARIQRVKAALQAAGATDVKVLSTEDIVTATLPQGAIAALGLADQLPTKENGVYHKSVGMPAKLAGDVKRAVASRGVKKLARGPAPGAQAGVTQTPATLRSRYNIPSSIDAPANYTQGVAGFYDFFKVSDLKVFDSKFDLSTPTMKINGPYDVDQAEDATEGTLDVQYITSVSGGLSTWWISNNEFDFTSWGEQVMSLDPMPYVVSVSYGEAESTYGYDAMAADDTVFKKLGLLGVSVMVSSGDNGPGQRGVYSCSKFMSSWPASSQYVTAVGATYESETDGTECSTSWSGGGFSQVTSRPYWQESAVAAYLEKSGLPDSSFFNSTNRAVPDVAALGANFRIYAPNGEPTASSDWQLVSGTSASSPTFAGLISHIVAKRMNNGESALGFLNPKLYALGKVGTDVTSGASVFTECYGYEQAGFPAKEGWDAVTGLGTPNYEYLIANL